MSDTPGSVTGWLHNLKAGDTGSLKPLWDRYYIELVELARRRILSSRAVSSASDEEDVALSTIDALHRGVRDGRFAELNDRDELLRLLLCIINDKLVDRHRHDNRARRGGGKVIRANELESPGSDFAPSGEPLDRFASPEPTPEDKAIMGEEVCRRLEQLDAMNVPDLRRVAELKLNGLENKEIAAELGYSLRTIVQRLALIRETWQ